MSAKDHKGRTFSRWLVLELVAPGNQKTPSKWLCRCECGTEKVVMASSLVSGASRSCGCLLRELAAQRSTTHGLSSTRTFNIWMNMLSRCRSPSSSNYKRYGAKGIEVCARWSSFENFYADMGECPQGMTIDRKNGAKGYEPSNCRWATRIEQNRNIRSNHLVTHKGATKCLAEWAEEVGISAATIGRRIKKGWSADMALSTPARIRVSRKTLNMARPSLCR